MTEGVQVGCYPRLNGKMVHSGNFVERIVSVVGVFVQDDGEVAVFECSDGGTFSVSHAPDQFVQIGIPFFVEAVGSLAMDETGQPIMNVSSFFFLLWTPFSFFSFLFLNFTPIFLFLFWSLLFGGPSCLFKEIWERTLTWKLTIK